MATYDFLVKFYSSWIDDINDEAHDFSDEEKGKIYSALARCQFDRNLNALNELPRTIKRGLSIKTMGEQTLRIIARQDAIRARGAKRKVDKQLQLDLNEESALLHAPQAADEEAKRQRVEAYEQRYWRDLAKVLNTPINKLFQTLTNDAQALRKAYEDYQLEKPNFEEWAKQHHFIN